MHPDSRAWNGGRQAHVPTLSTWKLLPQAKHFVALSQLKHSWCTIKQGTQLLNSSSLYVSLGQVIHWLSYSTLLPSQTQILLTNIWFSLHMEGMVVEFEAGVLLLPMTTITRVVVLGATVGVVVGGVKAGSIHVFWASSYWKPGGH